MAIPFTYIARNLLTRRLTTILTAGGMALVVYVFATVLMIMTARWKRIVEYWPPFAVMFAAFALHPWFEGARSTFTRLPADMLNELQPFLDLAQAAPPTRDTDLRELFGTLAVGFVALLLGVVLFFNLRATTKDIASSEPHAFYKAGAEWMRDNLPPGQLVFNTDWDDFPRLFYYDPSHSYITGLDPTYLYDKDPALSKLYDRITLGKEEDPGPLIRDRFGTRWVFSDNTKDHDAFYDNALRSGWFDRVYEDSDCSVLHIRDQKGEPPLEEKNNDKDKDKANDDEDNSP